MSLLTTIALAVLPAIRAKLPAVIEPPSLLDELDRAHAHERELEDDNAALRTSLEQAWRRNDELIAERDRARRTVDQLTDLLNYARPAPVMPAPIRPEPAGPNFMPLDVLERHYAGWQQAQQMNAAMLQQQAAASAQNCAYLGQGLGQQGLANPLRQDFCNCVPARHEAFSGHVSGD